MQGALYGARALAQGAGPLVFSYMFSYFSHQYSPTGRSFFPGALLGAL